MQRRPTKSRTSVPTSRAITRKSVGDTSPPEWNGTVVARPSAWRDWRWEPRYRTSTNPRR